MSFRVRRAGASIASYDTPSAAQFSEIEFAKRYLDSRPNAPQEIYGGIAV